MLTLAISVLGILITILLIVGVHELGHFLTARVLGVKILRFSIGFGKALFSWHDKTGTEYVLAAIPLGGYVKMLDETEGSVAADDLPFAYNRQPIWKKFLIVAAGPVTNLVFAFVLYWLLFVIGFTSITPIIGNVVPNSIAAQAGLQPQQEIISVDNQTTNSWVAIAIRILSHSGDKDYLTIKAQKNNEPVKQYQLNLSQWHMNELQPDPINSLGLVPYAPEIPALIGKIIPNSAAEKAHLAAGDTILSFDNKPIKNWDALILLVDASPNKTVPLTIKRKGKIQIFSVTLDSQRDSGFKKHGFLGIEPQFEWPKNLLRQNKYGPIAAISHAWQNTYDFTYLNLLVFGKLLTGKISLQSLGGPISIFQGAGTALNAGIVPFFGFLAFLSIAIGIINILPIPGLDGGHILFQVIEVIYRRPLSLRVQMLMYRLGLIILLLLVFQAIINDVLRL